MNEKQMVNEEIKEPMISITVKQYAEYIMSMQKLIDIALVANQTASNGDAAIKMIQSIRAICAQSFSKKDDK